MIELNASQEHGGSKPWIARIKGTDPKFGLEREFLAARTTRSKSGSTCSLSAKVTQPGVYEECDTDRKGKEARFWFIGMFDGELSCCKLREETAYEIAEAMDSGKRPDDLIMTRTEDGKMSVRGGVKDGPLNWRSEDDAPAAGNPKADALATIKPLMTEHGITIEELR